MSANDEIKKILAARGLGDIAAKRAVRAARQRAERQSAIVDTLAALADSGALDHLLKSQEQEIEESTFEQDELDKAQEMAAAIPTSDSLIHKARLRSAFQGALAEKAAWARINPHSVMKGTLGGQQPVSSSTAVLEQGAYVDSATGLTVIQPFPRQAQLAMWQGDDEESLPVSVAFAPVDPAPVPVDSNMSTAALRSFGICRFGTRGMQVEVEVDIGRGCQFTVPASAVQLLGALEAVPDGFPGTGASTKIAGMLSFYPIVRTAPITRTRYVDSLAGNAIINLSVPTFAKSVIFYRSPQTEPFTLEFRTVSGAAPYQLVIAGGSIMAEPFILSPDIVSVQVHDTAGGGLNGRLIFILDL